MSEVQTNKISPATGTITVGDSGDTFKFLGATIANAGTATGFAEQSIYF